MTRLSQEQIQATVRGMALAVAASVVGTVLRMAVTATGSTESLSLPAFNDVLLWLTMLAMIALFWFPFYFVTFLLTMYVRRCAMVRSWPVAVAVGLAVPFCSYFFGHLAWVLLQYVALVPVVAWALFRTVHFSDVPEEMARP